jgi:hypothetical protein
MSKQIQSITEDTDGCYLCFEKIWIIMQMEFNLMCK